MKYTKISRKFREKWRCQYSLKYSDSLDDLGYPHFRTPIETSISLGDPELPKFLGSPFNHEKWGT